MSVLEFTGTGGIWEGSAGAAAVDINMDSALYFSGGGSTGGLSNDNKNVVTMGDNDLVSTGGLTMSVWVKPQAPADGGLVYGAQIFGKQANYNLGSVGYGLYWTHDSKRFYWNIADDGYSSDGDGGTRIFSGALEEDVWYHVVGTYNSSSGAMALWVNGVSVATSTPSNVDDLSTGNSNVLKLGGNGAGVNNGDAYFTGYIADARIISYAASVTEVKKLGAKINVEDPMSDGNYGLQWRLSCNEGTGHVIYDRHDAGTEYDGAYQRNGVNYSTDIWKGDQFSVNVQDNSTTTTGTTTITRGKLDCLSLTYPIFDGDLDYVPLVDQTAYDGMDALTISAWVKPTDAGDSTQQIIDKKYDSAYSLSINRGSNDYYYMYVNDVSLTGTTGSATYGVWQHVVMTYDSTGSGTGRLYLNGVLNAEDTSFSGSAVGANSEKLVIGGKYNEAGTARWNGGLHDVKIFRHALSAEQVSSLYSGTYNETPDYGWKLQQGAYNALDGYGTGNSGNGHDATGVSLSWENATLNLDAILTIETNGTLLAPKGNLDLGLSGSGNLLVRNGNGFFKHNNGKLRHTTANTGTIGTDFTGTNAFYDFEVSDGGGNVSFDGADIDIEHNTTGGAGNIKIYDNSTVTAGTDSHSCEWTNDTIFGMSSGSGGTYPRQTLQAKSQLKPINYNPASGTTYWSESSLDGAIAAGRYFAVKWINWKQALVIPYNANLTLLGDCSFEGNVTVDADDDAGGAHVAGRLDINGQRAEIAGTLDVNGTIYNTAGSTSKTGQIWGNAIQTAGSNNAAYCDLISDGGYFDADQTTYGHVFMRSGTHTIGGTRSWSSTPLIVGGTTNFNSDNTWGDITIATGGEFQGDGTVVNCGGDFTATGGLFGPSALVFDGTGDYITVADAAELDFNASGDVTLDCWLKAGTTGNDHNHEIIEKQDSGTGARWQFMYMHSADTIEFVISDGSGSATALYTGARAALYDDKWHNLVGVRDAGSTLKLYLDGKLIASATDTEGDISNDGALLIGKGGTGEFQGTIARVSVWAHPLTEAEIRTLMFYDFTAMENDDTVFPNSVRVDGTGVIESDLKLWHQFYEGTGDGVAAVADQSGNSNHGNVVNATWAPSGTLTWTESGGVPSAGTLNMTGVESGTLTYYNQIEFFNLTIAPSSGAGFTKLKSFPTSTRELHIHGTLTSGGGTIHATNSPNLVFLGDSTAAGNPNFSSCNFVKWRSTTAIPQMTSGYLYLDTIDATLGADHINTGYIRPAGNRTLHFSSYSMTTPRFYLGDGNSGLDLDSGSLIFTGSSSEAAANARLTGGPGCEIKSSVSGTKRDMPSNPDWEMVGDITDINIIDGGSHGSGYGIRVVGSASNCSGQIRQWHHTLDTKQLLDADEEGSDDMKLPNPSLDNALELDTGG